MGAAEAAGWGVGNVGSRAASGLANLAATCELFMVEVGRGLLPSIA